MRVDGHKRTIVLPGALAGFKPISATLEEGSLVVGFKDAGRPRGLRGRREARARGAGARRAGRQRGGARGAARTAGPAAPPPATPFPDLGALIALVDGLRGQLPPELARQLADALRELLVAIRAVLDYTIEKLEQPPQSEREVEDIPIS